MPSPGRKGCVNTFSGRLGCPLGILNVIVNTAPIMGRTAGSTWKEAYRASEVREGFLLPTLSAQLTIRLSALSFPWSSKGLVMPWIIVLMIHPAIQLHTRILPSSQLSSCFLFKLPLLPSGLSQLHNLSTKPNSQILFMMGDFIQSKLLFLLEGRSWYVWFIRIPKHGFLGLAAIWLVWYLNSCLWNFRVGLDVIPRSGRLFYPMTL